MKLHAQLQSARMLMAKPISDRHPLMFTVVPTSFSDPVPPLDDKKPQNQLYLAYRSWLQARLQEYDGLVEVGDKDTDNRFAAELRIMQQGSVSRR